MKTHCIRCAGYVVIVLLLAAAPTWGQQKYEVRTKEVIDHDWYIDFVGVGANFSENSFLDFYVLQTGYHWPKPFGVEVTPIRRLWRKDFEDPIDFSSVGIYLPILTVDWPRDESVGSTLNLTARVHGETTAGEDFPPFFDVGLEWRGLFHTISIGYRHQTKPFYYGDEEDP